MRQIPIISTGCDDLCVDDVRHCPRLFRDDLWIVTLRSCSSNARVFRIRIAQGQENGVASVAGREVRYCVRWRADRRRSLLAPVDRPVAEDASVKALLY